MKPEHAEFLRDAFVAAFEEEAPVTKAVVLAIPEERKTYKPDPDAMTAFDLARHAVTSDVWFLESVLDGEFVRGKSRETSETVQQLASWYQSEVDRLLPGVRNMSGEELAQTIDFFGLQFPRVVALSFFLPHTVHHRGQLAAYIRPMGGRVPNIYGPTAKDPNVPIEGPLERYGTKLAEMWERLGRSS